MRHALIAKHEIWDENSFARQQVTHYKIASPEKCPSDDNLPAKIRHARVGRIFMGILSVGGHFSGGGDSMESFYGAGDILLTRRHINFVIISPGGGFFMAEAF